MEILRLGSRGPQVELLQAGLNRAGVNVGIPDGIFGQATYSALQAFQRENGLGADGVFGEVSMAAMLRYFVGYFVHQVRTGETIFSLANNYNISSDSILTANPNIDGYNLYIGQKIIIPMPFQVTFEDISYSSEVLELVISGIVTRYPFIKTSTIGSSVLGKPLICLSIGEGENEVFYNASHHGNEWITTPILLKFLEQYAESYAIGGTIFDFSATEMYQKTTINLIPMVNPDGVDLVVGAIDKESPIYQDAYAMNNNAPNFPRNWKANINGVDLNVNYPAFWRKARENKFAQGITRPAPRDYVGPSPLSEPETQAVALFTLQHHFRLSLSYHSQGQVIFWKFLDFEPPMSREIAERFSEVSGYNVEETPSQSGYAGYKDWFIMTYDLPAYTIEVGLGENPLPIAQFAKIYNDNLGILVLGANL